eukprot:7902379-Alexandrium_andersonii.AAC.1
MGHPSRALPSFTIPDRVRTSLDTTDIAPAGAQHFTPFGKGPTKLCSTRSAKQRQAEARSCGSVHIPRS